MALMVLALRLEPAISILAAIEIVRSKDDEPALGEGRAEIVVGRLLPIDGVSRHAIAPVLDHHHRAPLARLRSLGTTSTPQANNSG